MNKGIQDITTTMLQPPSVGLSIGNISIPSAISPKFSPMNIPGCRLWLDADDPYSLTLSGSSVVSWRDKSNSGLDVGYDVQANQPIYTRNYRDGRGAIRFGTGGVVSCLRSATPPIDGMTAWPMADRSMFAVYEVLTRKSTARIMMVSYGDRGVLPPASTNTTESLILNAFAAGGTFTDTGITSSSTGSVAFSSSQLTLAGPHSNVEATAFPETTGTGCVNYASVIRPRPNVEVDPARSTSRGGEALAYLRRNGRIGNFDRSYNSSAYFGSTLMIQRLYLGCVISNPNETLYTLSNFLEGNIYEIAVFDRVTNNGEILALEEYFRSKWCPNQPPVYLQN